MLLIPPHLDLWLLLLFLLFALICRVVGIGGGPLGALGRHPLHALHDAHSLLKEARLEKSLQDLFQKSSLNFCVIKECSGH